MRRLPVISGDTLIKFLESLGYKIIRQKGSHVRLRKKTKAGLHNITVPKHKEIAKGTLNDILSRIAIWNNMSKEEVIKILKKHK